MSDSPPTDLMDYPRMTQAALRGLIRQALLRAASPQGLPGDHHFFVTFLTQGRGVSVPPDLLAKYPHDITIVLQHQFKDLRVADDFFRVTLTFGGVPKILTVPWVAIIRFQDPYAQFQLEFPDEDIDGVAEVSSGDHPAGVPTAEVEVLLQPATPRSDIEKPASDDQAAETGDKPKIVSLDQFRKK